MFVDKIHCRLEKANASSNGRAFAFFVTGIPGDEVERAGMALQYPLLSASAIQALQFFYFSRTIYKTNTNLFVLSPLWWYHIKAK